MARDVARAGAIAGWTLLAGILILQVGIPSVIAGQQLSGIADPAAIAAHYDHAELGTLTALDFLLVLPLVVFAVALRETLAVADRARFAATLGLAFLIVEAPVILTQYALQGTLVTIASSGDAILPVFRFWDLLYNGAVYALEAGVVVSFGLAARGNAAFPGWLPAFSLVVATIQIVNIAAVFGWIPAGVTLIGSIGFAIWLGASSFGLMRVARGGAPSYAPTVPPAPMVTR
jgi:hypothetical protein